MTEIKRLEEYHRENSGKIKAIESRISVLDDDQKALKEFINERDMLNNKNSDEDSEILHNIATNELVKSSMDDRL